MTKNEPSFRCEMFGFEVHEDAALGHLWVYHYGDISWDQLQAIKTEIWGADARAIELYPAEGQVVNMLPCRHLWRLGAHDFAPDLLGDDGFEDSLIARHALAWAEARKQGPV